MKTMKKKVWMSAWGVMFTFAAFAQGSLTVTVKNVRSPAGQLLLTTQRGEATKAPISGESVVLHLKQVPEGECTLYVMQDLNANFQMDWNGQLPAEPCGMKAVRVEKGENHVEMVLQEFGKKR